MIKSEDDFLLEIGTEELPARFVEFAFERIQSVLASFLEENGLRYGGIKSFGSPRRLVVQVYALQLSQGDRTVEVRGPAKRAAVDDNGQWTTAAQGFARSQGVAVDDLRMVDTQAGPYVFAVKEVHGQQTKNILAQHLSRLITSIDWPKSMRWGTEEMRFLRPVRWLLALLGEEVIPFTLAGVQSANTTFGHRTLAPQTTVIHRPDEYVDALRKMFVVVDVKEREQMILDQVQKIANDEGYQVQVDEDLLSEVTELVEYPTAFMGHFNSDYLAIPDRIIVTSMKENQRYFPLYNDKGELASRFIGVRNGGDRNLEQVVKGNEKVLSARLADAAFFFAEDKKVAPQEWREKLKFMTYQDDLGSVYDREGRISKIAHEIAENLQFSATEMDQVYEVSKYLKFDLATHMVYEFPELEGYMGGVYAHLSGCKKAIGQAITEQYMPKSAGAPIASSQLGKVMALADKIERLVGGVSVLGLPTGSQDPYGLRRAAMGIVRTLADGEIPLSLQKLVNLAAHVLQGDSSVKSVIDEKLTTDVLTFLSARFKTWLVDQGLPSDVADGLVSVRPYAVHEVARISMGVADQVTKIEFKTLVEVAKRVRNILAKQSVPSLQLQIDMFSEPVERQLFESTLTVQTKAREELSLHNAVSALQFLILLESPITAFFDQVMVMDPDEGVRLRRLALLNIVQNTLSIVLDLSKIESI